MTFFSRAPFSVLWLAAFAIVALKTTGMAAEPMAARQVDPVSFRSVLLWEGEAPQAKGRGPEDRPHLDVFLAPKERATGCAMIVCPGGGFRERAMDWEGMQVAQWLNTQGIHAFVLSYRISPSGYDREVAWLDGARAVRFVRAHAADYAVSPQRIGVIGFSAGGVIASKLAETFDAGAPAAVDPVERVSSRPDFVVPVYGRVLRQAGEAAQPVPANTPPTFTVLTLRDETIDPQSAVRELQALRQAGVEAELHIFGGDGAHGRGLYTGDPATGEWPSLLVNWLRRNALLTDRERVAVEGVMTIDGVPMFAGWVTFIPVDDPNLPTAAIFYNDKYRKVGKPGRYYIEQKFGPVPGRYRVEVRHVSKDFILVPSMEAARLYTRLAPNAEPLVVEVKAGANVVDLAIRTQ
jgi:acetyl esterase/lipase